MKRKNKFAVYWAIFGTSVAVGFFIYSLLIEFPWLRFLSDTRVWLAGLLLTIPLSMIIANKIKV